MKKILLTTVITIILFFSLNSTLWILSFADSFDCSSGHHDYSVEKTEPTATQDGEIRYNCVLCKYTYAQILPALNHHWGDWIIDTEPTCAAIGEMHRTCTTTDNHHRQYENIPVLNHLYSEKIIPSTCTEIGKIIYTCSRCSAHKEEEYGQLKNHSYEEKITLEPTAETAGIKTFSCIYCGHSYEEIIPVLELTSEHVHSFKITKNIEPTCDTAGEKIEECSICGEIVISESKAIGHKYGEWIVDKKENFFEDGHRYKVCEHNENHIIEEIIPKRITGEVTPVAVGLNIGNLAFILLWIIMIGAELRILKWERTERAKRKAYLSKKRGW